MKYKKSINYTGPRGTFVGSVEIAMDYKTERRVAHNPSTHEDDMITVPVHQINGIAEGGNVVIKYINTRQGVLSAAQDAENWVLAKLREMEATQTLGNYDLDLIANGYEPVTVTENVMV